MTESVEADGPKPGPSGAPEPPIPSSTSLYPPAGRFISINFELCPFIMLSSHTELSPMKTFVLLFSNYYFVIFTFVKTEYIVRF